MFANKKKLKAIKEALTVTELLPMSNLSNDLYVLCGSLEKQKRKNNVQIVSAAKIVVDVINEIKTILND